VIGLAACVTGLGRLGEAGDMLGLEFAWRRIGAATVVASLWDVDFSACISFFMRFYKLWLGCGFSRAAAWQAAVLESFEGGGEGGLPQEAAMCLFGDWR
jgi:CHAT domain-containing protein